MLDFLQSIHIFGAKTTSLMDVWTIEHVLSGISVGSAVRKKHYAVIAKLINRLDHDHHSYYLDFVGVLFLAFFWETIEHYLETGLVGIAVSGWLQGIEFWGNRIISDPLMLIFGYLIAKRIPRFVWPARFLSLLWLLVHVFAFPDSMYLQRILFGS